MYKLISFVGQDDSDILPHFLAHYRKLGISAFHVFLRGTWSDADLEPLRADDVVIAGVAQAPHDDAYAFLDQERYAKRFQGEWLIFAKADAFLELPFDSLDETVASLRAFGISELPATLLQRAHAEGKLASLSDEGSPSELYDHYDFGLAERMQVEAPIPKTTYPLAYVGESFRLSGGNHLPHSGQASAHLPIRGVLHHYAWRDCIVDMAADKRELSDDQVDGDELQSWLAEHDFCLPTEGLKPYSRDALFDAGYLIRPTDAELETAVALEKCRETRWQTGDRQVEAHGPAERISPAAEQVDERAPAYLDRQWLTAPPGRIALVTMELPATIRTGGIGTAMAALADRLSAAGHEVHLLYCPFSAGASLPKQLVDHWRARGVATHFLPRYTGLNGHAHPYEHALSIADALKDGDWDVIHFHEACGDAAGVLLLRAAGLAFQDTKIVVTAHGATAWHRRGNFLPWSPDEAMYTQLESISSALADVIVSPSAYMVDWLKKHLPSDTPHIVVPNCLTGESRRFGRVSAEKRKVARVVFFGRVEFRKGIDVFADAIDHVLASGLEDFEVIFLGRSDGAVAEQLAARTENWTCATRHIANLASHEAVDLLRTQNCLAVLPSRVDNSPYTVYECLENGVPFIASDVGGISELIHEEDRERALVGGGAKALAERMIQALSEGIAPARLRFDPTHADIDQIALHGRLVADARSSRGSTTLPSTEATMIVHGTEPLDLQGPLAKLLWAWASDGVEIIATAGVSSEAARTRLDLRSSPVASAGMVGGAALNDVVETASRDCLLFCHASVVPDEGALRAMRSAMENTNADAIVCGFSTAEIAGGGGVVPCFAGPAAFSADENVYGARLFLVRRDVFVEAGGFAEEPGLEPVIEWEFLNRLSAAGKRVFSVPVALARVPDWSPPPPLTDTGRARLAARWIQEGSERLQGLLAKALSANDQATSGRRLRLIPRSVLDRASQTQMSDEPADEEPGPLLFPAAATGRPTADLGDAFAPELLGVEGRRRAHPEPSTNGPDRGFTPAEEPTGSRISGDGRLIDASGTFVVQSSEDAEACDFFVADDLLSGSHCAALERAFHKLKRRTSNGIYTAANRFFRLSELAAIEPSVDEIVAAAMERAIALTKHFFEVEFPIYPTQLRVIEVPEGRCVTPPVAALGRGAADGPVLFEFAGAIQLNTDFEGGEIYFPALDISVEPKRARLLATTVDQQHQRAVLRVESGSQLILTFNLASRPEAKGHATPSRIGDVGVDRR